jgi:cellulose synthase/poly-beta-1,6-N-acetylglucosamine synthase-like glycosyltransferase
MPEVAVILAIAYGAAMLVLLVGGLHLLVLSISASRGAMHRELVEGASSGSEMPVVTVQVPLYNEPAVAARVVDAVASLDYPRDRLEIQILDDSSDATPPIVAERVTWWRATGLNISHVRRAARDGYKAGALANGLQLAKGEFVAIFDADFLPAPNFLRHALRHFCSDRVGMVQARWGHLNGGMSALTRVQAFGLDAHFAVEQEGRRQAGAFMSFNGTAGVWRRACIEDAGGWSADTLAEDLDLSYRAQMRGWEFRYVHELEVPAELPADMPAVRSQQYRWTKGAAEAARKLLAALLAEPLSMRTRVLGGLHLTAHAAFPALLVAALTHAPLMAARDALPWPVYFSVLAVGLIGFAGFLSVHLVAQRRLHPDWLRRQAVFPLFMIGSIGLSAHNTMAFVDGLRGLKTPFVRTPKTAGHARAWIPTPVSPMVWVESFLALYSMAGLGLLFVAGAWDALPFQMMFVLGFSTVVARHLMDVRDTRRPLREVATN